MGKLTIVDARLCERCQCSGWVEVTLSNGRVYGKQEEMSVYFSEDPDNDENGWWEVISWPKSFPKYLRKVLEQKLSEEHQSCHCGGCD
jgi:hypothetical protein